MKSLLFGLCMIMVTIQLSYQQCPSASFNPSESRCQLLTSHSDSRPTPVTYPLATLAEGQSFEIRGTATANNAFSINFVNAQNNNINGFHMAFRINLNELIFNFHTKVDGWDYNTHKKTDIVPVAGDYVVLVHLANNQWNVLVNGKRTSYAVNVPYNQLNGLYFTGPFNVRSVRQFASSTEPCPFSQSSCIVLSGSSTTQSTPANYPLLNFAENSAVEIRGNANSIFSVNFVNSNDKNINAFHLAFRLNLRELIYNFHTKVDGWDYNTHKKTDFVPVAGDYVIVIRATKDQWLVSVNGVHSSSYPVNVPYNQVNALFIDGGISVKSIGYFTEPCPLSQSSCSVLSASSTTQSTPVNFPLLNFAENNAVEIRGNANSIFSVNFVNSNDKNINAFHLAFRLNLRELIYNFHTKVDGWDYNTHKKTDFVPVAGDYVIVVRATKSQWLVSVNGVHSSSFPVNVPYNKVNALFIDGGISVKSIRYLRL